MLDKAPQDNRIHSVIERCLPGMEGNTYIEEKVMNKIQSNTPLQKKYTLRLAIATVLLCCSIITAVAMTIISSHEINIYDNIDIVDLMPEQWNQYDICHPIKGGGYIIGGFSLEDDLISPMEESDAIAYVDSGSHVQWELTDPRLAGGLFDHVISTDEAVYLGTEQETKNGWVPAILKINMQGEVLWLYQGDSSVRIKDYILLSDGRLLCVGSKTEDASGTQRAYICILNDAGQIIAYDVINNYDLLSIESVRMWNKTIMIAGMSQQGTLVLQLYVDGTVTLYDELVTSQPALTLQLREAKNGNMIILETFSKGFDDEATTGIRYRVLPTNSIK